MKCYQTLKEAPLRKRLKENNDCGVLALALTTGLSYNKAHAALKKHGRKNRDGTWTWQVHFAAKDLGFKLERVAIPPKAKTVSSLPYELSRARVTGKILINCTGHFAAYIDGRVEDWSKGRRKRLKALYKVVPL